MLLGSSLSRLEKLAGGSRESKYYNKLALENDVQLFQYAPSPNVDMNRGPRPFQNKWLHSLVGPIYFLNHYKSSTNLTIVRSKQLWGAWAGSLLARLTGRPHIIRCGYIWSRSFIISKRIPKVLHWLVRFFELKILQGADAYIFCSQDTYDFYKSYSKVGKKPSLLLQNYVDGELFSESIDVCERSGCIYLGRLIELKGIRDTMGFIERNKMVEDSLIIGSGPLNDLAKKQGFEIVPHVNNDDLPQVFSKYKYFVSFSKTEGSPKALLEAIFCGLIPVVSDIPAHREIVDKLGYGVCIKDFKVEVNLNFLEVNKTRLNEFRQQFSMLLHIDKETSFMHKVASDHKSNQSV